ncbi:hypothetical protein L1281_002477 [Neisseria sp. HSC-16F19]|nr:DUF1887 family CARF protein [Neisseria sp. HSC-16F19]MCP2041859.1 hypothetical protein [Neisseria sp. HSC-16F19]
MEKFDVHVCLVSDQAVPNFVPVLDADFRPQQVVLLVTPPMQAKADYLQEVMRTRCQVQVTQIPVASAYDMEQVGGRIVDLLYDMDKAKVALNTTGGTKLMAIAAYDIFRDMGYPAFYFSAESNEVLLLGKQGKLGSQLLQPPKIKIEDYLRLHGYPAQGQVRQQLQQRQWLPLAQELVQAHQSLAPELGALNAVISKAVQSKRQALHCDLPHAVHAQHGSYLLSLLEQYGVAQQQGQQLHFADVAARDYIAGAWFEDYVFHVAKSLPGVQDIALNVQIENARQHIRQHNELDVVLLVNNVLHVLECKTANLAKQAEGAQTALYKLESLKKLGGLRTRAMLISYRGLNGPIRDRATGAGIRIIEQNDLSGMKTLLEKWTHAK